MALLHFTLAIFLLAMAHISYASTDQEIFLAKHNAARASVGVGPVTWDETLASYARNFTESIKNACYPYSSGGLYGENVAVGYGAETVDLATNSWINEKSYYDHSSNKCVGGKVCKHYTQVVWRNSKRIGCASVVCGAGWPYRLCEYYPRGNIPGQRPY
ncbi:Pathogenesis-related protein [Drosera capensis]